MFAFQAFAFRAKAFAAKALSGSSGFVPPAPVLEDFHRYGPSPVQPLPKRKRSGQADGHEFEIVAEFFPGMARGSAFVPAVAIEDVAPQSATAPGAAWSFCQTVEAGAARGATNYDRALIDADLLAISSL